jgi:uncharacterized protein
MGEMKQITRRRFLKQLRGGLLAAGLVASYPFVIERYLVLTNMYRIPVPRLPKAFYGFRIVHLTDLHYGPLVPLAVIRYVVHRTNHLKREWRIGFLRLIVRNEFTKDKCAQFLVLPLAHI